MLDLGDVKTLSINVTDSAGAAANATNVALTIVEPDDVIVTVSTIAPTVLGQYDYNYTTSKVGRHSYRWVATGNYANAYTGIFEVRTATDSTFLSLEDMKAYLNITSTVTTEDAELRDAIVAACDVVEFLCGAVAKRTYTEYLDGAQSFADGYFRGDFGNYAGPYRASASEVQVTNRPISSITSVTEIWGNTPNVLNAVAIPDTTNDTNGYSYKAETGVITRRAAGWPTSWPPGAKNIKVVYTAGRVSTPGNVMFGTKELVAHLWRISQNNSEGRRPRITRAEPVTVVMGYAIPNRVLEMLGATPRIPTIG